MKDRSHVMIERFMSLHPKAIDLSLGRIARLLNQLGNPHERLPPTIHVAGTNGKGSTIAFMRSILENAGLSVHVYTSPHLVRFHERIRLGKIGGGVLVDDETLTQALERCEAANAGEPITVFEMTTAAAFLIFSEHFADVLLLETGLGGRLDATNVLAKPAACVVTPIGLDHADFLGRDLAVIAQEKAGIFKKNAPAIIAAQDYPLADSVLEKEAQRKGSLPVLIGRQDFSTHEEHGRLIYQDQNSLMDLPLPRLMGRHQWVNAGTAIAAVKAAGFSKFEDDIFEKGMQKVQWPARLQALKTGKLRQFIPQHAELWLDGGHNADGGRVLAAAMADLEEKKAAPLVLICGMLNTKDSLSFFKPFLGLARQVITVPVPGNNAARSPEDVAAIAVESGLSALSADSVSSALKALTKQDWHIPPRILICGSLYLAGAVLEENNTPPE